MKKAQGEKRVRQLPHNELARQCLAQFAEIAPGQVRTWFVPATVDFLARLSGVAKPPPGISLVTASWPAGADVNQAIDRIVESLADVALARWPDWFGESAPFANSEGGPAAAAGCDDGRIDHLGQTYPGLNRGWARRAIACCRRGVRPVVRGVAPAIQLKQLVLAGAEPGLVVLLALERAGASSAELLCFARTAAWLAGETGIRVAAVVPDSHARDAELDAIAYGAVTLGKERPAHAGFRAAEEPGRLVLPPILGKPHPASPGEQQLAAWLQGDAELGPLFAWNQRVDTSSGESFVVDLLWRDGKMAVEVDGYGWHSSPHAFAADRHRDYRLLSDGYRTLRLPHDEVMDDPALQCEKIRDVVHAIQRER